MHIPFINSNDEGKMKNIRKIGEIVAGIGLYLSIFTNSYKVIGFWTMIAGAALLATWGLWWWKNWYFAK